MNTATEERGAFLFTPGQIEALRKAWLEDYEADRAREEDTRGNLRELQADLLEQRRELQAEKKAWEIDRDVLKAQLTAEIAAENEERLEAARN